MADANHTFDLVIIGGGPAGYVGAIRAAQLGARVACVERERLGGICLNWGCIPTKALLAEAEFYHRLRTEAADWGIQADNVRYDWSRIIGRSRDVADQLNRGIAALFKKNKVAHWHGEARILKPGQVQVTDSAGQACVLSCRNIIIATGAQPRALPVDGGGFDGERVIAYRQAMTLPERPKELLIVGAGAIGMEFAYFFHAFGTKVTVVEMLDRLLPVEDEEISRAIERSFRKLGITTLTATTATALAKTDTGVELTVAPVNDPKSTRQLTAQKVLVAVGVHGSFAGLFDEALGIKVERDHIAVDRRTYQTSVAGIYAVGDVIGRPWLAHVASHQAIACVEGIMGVHGRTHEPDNLNLIPACTYTQPQVASVGLTERALQQQGRKPGVHYKVGKFPFQASGRAQACGHAEGFVKLLSDAQTGEILGCHMIGDGVTELIAEATLAMKLEATADELIATVHAHPTLSEAVHEAALGTQGRTLHA